MTKQEYIQGNQSDGTSSNLEFHAENLTETKVSSVHQDALMKSAVRGLPAEDIGEEELDSSMVQNFLPSNEEGELDYQEVPNGGDLLTDFRSEVINIISNLANMSAFVYSNDFLGAQSCIETVEKKWPELVKLVEKEFGKQFP